MRWISALSSAAFLFILATFVSASFTAQGQWKHLLKLTASVTNGVLIMITQFGLVYFAQALEIIPFVRLLAVRICLHIVFLNLLNLSQLKTPQAKRGERQVENEIRC